MPRQSIAQSSVISARERMNQRTDWIADLVADLNDRAKPKTDVVLPSRPNLADGKTENPDYNPFLDPGSTEFHPAEFFDLRPEVEVYVGEDHENPHLDVVSVSVAGHTLDFDCNELVFMPIDFAEAAIIAGLAKLPKKKEDRRRRRR